MVVGIICVSHRCFMVYGKRHNSPSSTRGLQRWHWNSGVKSLMLAFRAPIWMNNKKKSTKGKWNVSDYWVLGIFFFLLAGSELIRYRASLVFGVILLYNLINVIVFQILIKIAWRGLFTATQKSRYTLRCCTIITYRYLSWHSHLRYWHLWQHQSQSTESTNQTTMLCTYMNVYYGRYMLLHISLPV